MAPMPSRLLRGVLGQRQHLKGVLRDLGRKSVVRCQSFVNDHEFGADQIRNAKIIQGQLPEE